MKRGAPLFIAALAVVAGFTIARPQHAAGPSLRDFEAYYAAGATWMQGGDPYTMAIWENEQKLPGVVAQRHEVLPFVSPPVTLPLWAAFARLPYGTAANLWRAVLLVSVVVLIWLAVPLANIRRSPSTLLALAIAALSFGAITNAFALGQVALPVAAAIVAAFVANGVPKALAAVIACTQPNAALALAGCMRNRRAAIAVLGGAAAFATVCIGVVGLRGFGAYIQTLQAHGHAERFSAIQLTPAAIAYGFGAPETAAAWIGLTVALVGIIVWLIAVIKLRDELAVFCITCALVPFVSPFFHQQDLVIAFVPAVVLVLRASPSALRIAIAGALFCATNWLGIAQNPAAALQTALLTSTLAIALLALRGDVDRRAIEGSALIVFFVAMAGLVARARVLPVWPEAMPALSAAALHANIAAVWYAEQAATGLFARDTLWALFRCASLAGAALLVYAAFIHWRSPAHSRTSSLARDRSP